MFFTIENGTVISIPDNAFGFDFKCNLPPIGYGIHAYSGEIGETDILEFGETDTQQCWGRPQLPKDYLSRRKEEKKVQLIDPYYVDEYLEDIRKREWKRRMFGVWFYNYNPITKEVELIYITGLHYLYITYWRFQGKYMDFRMCDRDLFYVVSYCMFDPDCLGLNEITKRKNGKTARVGCWAYERMSRLNNHHAGLQSKTDKDGDGAFLKAVVHPWQKLPDFFKPRYDLMKGEEPSELRLFPTARRGSKIEEDDNIIEEALESFFDHMPASESAYDGPELDTYISDEAGKTKKPVSILERQRIVRYCSELDGVMKGKQWYTTTVEIEEGEEESDEFQKLTKYSNPLDRDENNRTTTGLYTYFLPAQKGMFRNAIYTKYGFADEIENLTWLNNNIQNYLDKNDLRGLSSFKRKNPRNFKEAFSTDGERTLYNPEILNQQWDEIFWTDKFTEFGDLEWIDGYKVKRPMYESFKSEETQPSGLRWVSNPKGKFEKLSGWFPKEPNKVYLHGMSYAPNNTFRHKMGCDPFRYDKTKDKRRSNCAAFVYQMPDDVYPDAIYDNAFVLRYAHREESTTLANEDILKMAWWCGCEVLFERNVNHWKKDFNDWECSRFYSWMPGEVEPGIITAGNAVQTICNYTEAYINQHIKKVFFRTLIHKDTGWLGFKVEDTEKFDEPMAAGITLVAVKGQQLKIKPQTKELNDYFSFAEAS